MSNTFGTLFRLTTYGESHGAAVGGIIDGCPAGLAIDEAFVQGELNRRRPGQSAVTTGRDEKDKVEFLSGIYEGVATGTPIAFLVRNTNQHSNDYEEMRTRFRPSHADYTYYAKYGLRDHRGGGRSSARETLSRVVGGAIAKLALRQMGIEINAYTQRVGDIALDTPYHMLDLASAEGNVVRCPDAAVAKQMEELILRVKQEGDTIGGVVACVIKGLPTGLGEPAFGKLHAMLGAAMLGINACKGFEYGMGFEGAGRRGSEMNDVFDICGGRVRTLTNHSGGIQGGISNGEDVYFRCAFKPIATLLKEQDTINTQMQRDVIRARGRHDPCVLPRAVPIVEAMAALTVLDAVLLNRATRLE